MANTAAIFQPVWTQPKTKNQIIAGWLEAAATLKQAKECENRARLEVIAALGFDPDKREGTEYVDLENGYKLKAVKKCNYNLNNENDATDKALQEIEKMGGMGQFVAERLVKWKPDLSISEYRKLDADMKKAIDKVLTVTDGTPSLELIAPKDKA